MKQISEEDRKRIEAQYPCKNGDSVEMFGGHSYFDILTYNEQRRIGAIAENAHLSKMIRELEGVLGMAKAHMRDCTYSPQDLTQQENERFKHILDEIDRLLNQPTKP
jgi:hypothetical protein